jgi:hypothetical protein
MPTLTIARIRPAGITLALLLASFGVTSCGAEEPDASDPSPPGAVDPGGSASALNPAACAAVARGGKVDICHVSDLDAVPDTALTVPVESCSTTHAEHVDDFLADRDSGCKQEKKMKCTPIGKSCKQGSGNCCDNGACVCLTKKCQCF